MKHAFLLITAVLTSAASAQEMGFKGVPLGASKEDLLARFPSLECKAPGRSFRLVGEEYCQPKISYSITDETKLLYSYGGQPATDASFGIVGGKFGKFTMKFEPHRYEAIKNSLQTAFGKGQETAESKQTNGGVRFTSRTFKVARPQGSITLMEHAGRIDEGAVFGSTPEFDAYMQRVMSGDPKTGSKDL